MRSGLSLLGIGVIAACQGSDAPSKICDPPRGEPMNRFADITTAAGIDFGYSTPDFKGAGLAVADLDGDGLPEIVGSRRIGGLAYFRNRGNRRFEKVLDSGLDPTWAGSAIATADLDNDGDLDLVISGQNVAHLMANNGDGTFVEAQRFDDIGITEQILPVDLDNDGKLDLYFSNYDLRSAYGTMNRVFHNQGNLQFAYAGTAGGARSWSATAIDIDDDGDKDLYVANDTLVVDFGGPTETSTLPPDMLLRNDGFGTDGQFHYTDLATTMGLTAPRSSMGGLLADFNDDGRLDVLVPNFGANKLFLRDATGGFVESAAQLGLAAIERDNDVCGPGTQERDCLLVSWTAKLSDFDLDGYDELVVVNGETELGKPPPVLMYVNTPDEPWHEVAPSIDCLDARAMVVTDIDGDGDQDLVIAQKSSPLVVYENRGTPSATSWLRVTLRGTTSNRDGAGALVIAHLASGRTVQKPIAVGGMIHIGSPAEAFIGLGEDSVQSLEVHWPSGRITTVPGPLTGAVTLDEG
ncbi:MAG TPA: CRTAC1 family protein [Kofleriaceae bacterium]|nr:CRTAC1 family protein [Kofleriaceae bacterium]